jgi:hypothetical protein
MNERQQAATGAAGTTTSRGGSEAESKSILDQILEEQAGLAEPKTFCVYSEMGAELRERPVLIEDGEEYETVQEDAVQYVAEMGAFRGVLIACDKLPKSEAAIAAEAREKKAAPYPWWFRYRFILTEPPSKPHPKTGETYQAGQTMWVGRSKGLTKLDDLGGAELVVNPTRKLSMPPPRAPMQVYEITRIAPRNAR